MSTEDAFSNLGISIESIEKTKNSIPQDIKEAKPPLIEVKPGIKDSAVKLSLIPKAFIDAEFDGEHIKQNIMQQNSRTARKFKVVKFNEYMGILNSILTGLRASITPECSYIVGAPNGFGKTSFANTAIKVMYANGMKCVPYISLFELCEIKKQTEKEMLKSMLVRSSKSDDGDGYLEYVEDKLFRKKPEIITGDYSWSEYMNSDLLICYFSSLDSKDLESKILKTILETRGVKGLPTLVFISTSLDPYVNDKKLGEYIWDEILAYKQDRLCYDRVYHVSCYKKTNPCIGNSHEDIGI